MPKEVLHLLYGHDEAKPLILGEPIHIETHGIESIVIQVERKRYPKPANGVAVIESEERKLLGHTPQVRHKTAQCRWCHRPSVPQGVWKHEKYCEKNPKRTKRGNEL